VFTADQVKAALPRSQQPPTRRGSRLVSIENTSNGGFGTVANRHHARRRQGRGAAVSALHMDGARLCNPVKSGIKASDYGACVDSAMARYTKGLGAPVGASLAGSKDYQGSLAQKQMLGARCGQSGVIAAAALYALEHNWTAWRGPRQRPPSVRGHRQHQEGLEIDVPRMETNLSSFEVRKPGWTAAKWSTLQASGVGIGRQHRPTRIRAVTPPTSTAPTSTRRSR